MNTRLLTRALSAILLTAALALFFAPKHGAVFAQKSQSKADLTPTFWQRDPDADFEDEGRMHCAPTAVSDGLIYLARAFGMTDLVPGTQRKTDQIKLIEELAEHFQTDPSIGGTNPDKKLICHKSNLKFKDFKFNRIKLFRRCPVYKGKKMINHGT